MPQMTISLGFDQQSMSTFYGSRVCVFVSFEVMDQILNNENSLLTECGKGRLKFISDIQGKFGYCISSAIRRHESYCFQQPELINFHQHKPVEKVYALFQRKLKQAASGQLVVDGSRELILCQQISTAKDAKAYFENGKFFVGDQAEAIYNPDMSFFQTSSELGQLLSKLGHSYAIRCGSINRDRLHSFVIIRSGEHWFLFDSLRVPGKHPYAHIIWFQPSPGVSATDEVVNYLISMNYLSPESRARANCGLKCEVYFKAW